MRVEKKMVGDTEINAVDARELHEFLGSKYQFSNWIKSKIKKYNFKQGVDFVAIKNSVYSPPTKEYTI